jgi:hypothetical protein
LAIESKDQEVGDTGRREAVAAALGGARTWVALLELVHAGLLRGAAAIEPSAAEADPEVDLDRMDWPTEVRSVLRNVADGYLRPAIEDLRELLGAEER